jgi:radical SAM protein with 4Fe4S-binding SPASM domain
MILLSYWLRLARLSVHYFKRSTILPYFPLRTWIELTSHCNFACPICPNRLLDEKEKGFMDFGLFEKIIDEAQDFLFEANLAHRGESLLHPRLLEMIAYAKKRRLYTRLHTNSSLLSEKMAEGILRSGLDRLSFSFDGYDKETYEKIRAGGQFEKAVDNIVRFLEMKKKARSKKPLTSVEVIAFDQEKTNNSSLVKDRLLALFKHLRPSNLVIKQSHNWAGEFKADELKEDYSLCPFPWNTLAIFWNGNVLPCPQDFFGRNVVGNVKDSSLRKIWNGERMITLRKKLAMIDMADLPTCLRCDRIRRKTFLGVPREYLWKYITKRMP